MSCDLTYNIAEGTLRGSIDGKHIDAKAGAGGRAGSTTEGVVNRWLADNPLATHIGGAQSAGTHNFGPVPIGKYRLKTHEEKTYWIRLVPDASSNMYERSGFAIHRKGPTGSHGCIVPEDSNAVVTLYNLVKAREDAEETAPTLQVVAVGLDPAWQMRRFQTTS